MAKLTIIEIAKLANVSPSAVSIVLNNKKGVSDDTRNKITEIIERLQYTPNPNSRRLIFNKTNNIAVLFKKNISPLDHFFYSEINNAILQECELLGYNLIFASVAYENGNVILPNVIKAYDVDGVIFYGDMDNEVLDSIKKFDIPFIIVDSHLSGPNVLRVNANYMEAAYVAVSYLISIGHTRIAYIGDHSLTNYSTQTFAGYKKAIDEHKISIPMNWVQIDATDETAAYSCMKSILDQKDVPSAVFCCADIYAIGAINCIKNSGLSVPKDISVVGVDDIILSTYVDPPLTTIKIDKNEMGRIAINMLTQKIQNETVENAFVKSDNLIVRKSTAQR
jgi:LacI family transcriptional regulator